MTPSPQIGQVIGALGAHRNQRLIDMQAPLLLRPLDDDPEDRRNWVLKAIERTGQPIETALVTWTGAFALENQLAWDAMVAYIDEADARETYQAIWERLPPSYREAVDAVFTIGDPDGTPKGLALERDAAGITEAMGLSIEDALIFWNRGFTGHDHQMWREWEDRFGARDAAIMYSDVWQGFALAFLDSIKAGLGKSEFHTTRDLADLNRAYWEAIGSEVEDIEVTEDRVVAIIKTCPFFDNMVDMYGKEAANEMMKKTIGPTSANYYQALVKAIGLWDEFYVTQDQFRCLGDGDCRMVYERRTSQQKETA